jgi:hypothetical protein
VALFAVPAFAWLIVSDATAATAAAAGLALIGAVVTLDHAATTARRTLTADYRARWDHPDLLEARVVTSEFLNLKASDADKRWKEWRGWIRRNTETKKRLQIMAILNYWEEVASAYNQGLLDAAWFRADLAWQLRHNWDRAGWFILKFRAEDCNAAYYSEWQLAVEAVKDDLGMQYLEGQRRAKEALARGDDLLHVRQ